MLRAADAVLGVLDENHSVLEAERLFWAVRENQAGPVRAGSSLFTIYRKRSS